MATKKKGLGRGLDALLADVDHESGSIAIVCNISRLIRFGQVSINLGLICHKNL